MVGLQGRFAEAEEIARADLPPDEAASNVAYLKQMLTQAKAGKKVVGTGAVDWFVNAALTRGNATR